MRPLVEELEPRLLFSADFPAALTDSFVPQAEHRVIGIDGEFTNTVANQQQAQHASHEVVFVDTRVSNYQQLIDNIKAGGNPDRQLDIVMLDANQDGISQISKALSQYDNLDAVHLISHGSDGSVDIGNNQLNFESLIQNQKAISAWGHAFAANVDFLIYGCDVAGTAEGRAFVDALGRLTGADVAASTDKTGSVALGGDWVFEYQTGAIEAQSAVGLAGQAQWTNVLAITSNGTATSTQTTGATNLTWSHTVNSGTDRVLIVELSIDGLGAGVSSVTYGGVAMTQVGRGAANHAVEIWSLVNPTVGTANVIASFGATTAAAGGATTFNGVNQGTPTGTFASASGTGTTASVTVSSVAGDLVIDAQYWKDTSANLVGAGQISQWSASNATMLGGSTTETGAATVTMTGTSGASSQWEIGAVSIKAAPAQSLAWNSFAGGAGSQDAKAVAVDASGNSYVVGYSGATWGTPVRAYSASDDAYVSKFDSNGNLVWSTFLGGAGFDSAKEVTVDASGNVYVIGQSSATWGTPVRAYSGATDTFVAKLNSSGGLVWNTFIGGAGSDYGYGVTADASGNVYLTGNSSASWGTPVRGFGTGPDAYAVKLNSSGALTWNTFLGGTGSDGGSDIAVDGSGNVIVAGYSAATWGTPLRAFGGRFDAMVAKLNSSGTLTWNTFMGGAGAEYAESLDLDGSGNIYLGGYGSATWGAPAQAYGGGTYDGLAIKLNSSGTLVWNTFMGGSGQDIVYGITVDGSGNVFVAGDSDATWGTPWRAYSGGGDAFAAQLDSSGNRAWSAFLGGSGGENGYDVATDGSGGVYVAGLSTATWGTPVRAYSSGSDGYVVKINSPTPGITVTPTSGLTTTEAGGSAQFSVVLNTAPTANVTIGISSSDTTEGTVSTSSLTFTTANWSTPQTVTITGIDDTLDDGDIAYSIVTAAASSADAGYNGLNASDVSVTNTDNDTYNTLVVDTTSDTADGTTTSIAALMANKGADGKISLREAITAANNTANGVGGADRIYFNIAGVGPYSISVTAALPTITQTLIIDGTTEPDFAGTPVIELNGAGAGAGVDGLSLADGSDGSTIRGLAISRFTNHGIYIAAGADGNTIAGNFIGTDITGTLDLGNTVHGVSVYSNGNTIGGNVAADRNILSGNDNSGVRLTASANSNLVIGNFVGTDVSGTVDLGNTSYGVVLDVGANNNVIGGTTAAERNVISGNNSVGVRFGGAGTSNNVVQGNYIGTDVSGILALGNAAGVINDNSATSNRIGGVAAGAGNLIAYNTNRGVVMLSAGDINNPILGNAIHSNGLMGIDLGANGVTLNDAGDADAGSNNYQNFPVLSSAVTNGSSITIQGTLNSTASSYYRIEFFANTAQDGTGYGEGQTYLGFANVSTDASGNATINTTLTASVMAGEFVTATATKANATYTTFTDTSEFGQNMVAAAPNSAPVNTVPGAQTTNEDTALVFSTANGNAITINDADAGGNPVEVTLSVTNGTLTLGSVSGLTFVSGDGTADTTITVRGTIASINTALNGLSYTPTANYNGSATLTLATLDSTLVSLNIDSSLKGRYTFDNSGDLGNDSSPVGAYDGTVSGASSVNDATRGNVLSFDGNDYVQIAGHYGNPANVTLAAWVNLTAQDTNGADVISLGDSVVLRLDDIIHGTTLSWSQGGGIWNYADTNIDLAGTGWHHVAASFDDTNNTVTVYIDGTAMATAATTSSISYTLGANSFIGKHGNGETTFDFNGKIDDARVYNRALSATEIASLADDLSLTDTDTVGITVTAVNELPIITSNGGGATASISVAENTAAVTTVTATDADLPAQTLTYSISGGADAAKFAINGVSGALTFVTTPDYEVPTDAGGNNVYDVTVQVSDGNGGTDTQVLAVSVTNQGITAVSASGAATTLGGGSYTLNLAADEDATSWTINWGDGTIETVAGDPSSVTHAYAAGNSGLTFNILVSATDAAGTHFVNDMVAPTAFLTGEGLYRYSDSGAFEQLFSGAELTNPYAVIVGPDGLFYAAGHTSDNIVRYNATTGAYVDTFVAAGSGGLNAAAGLAFGPDGHLYVSNQIGDSILKFDGTTGALMSTFVSAGSGGLNAPVALIFRPDGYLYVGSYNTDNILRYNATTGAYVDTFVSAGSGGLNGPAAMAWGADGNLYVASNDATVKRYNGTTGAYIDNFVATGSGGLGEAVGLSFGPDGNLYVSSYATDKIIKYNGTTGALIGDYVATGSGGLDGPAAFTFLPNHQVKIISTNASPVITSNGGGVTANINIAENTAAVTTIAATDANGDALSYSISGGADAAKFAIDTNSGVLTFVAAPNYESPTDSGGNNVYDVTVQVSDGNGGADTQSITVNVINVNEAPDGTDKTVATNEDTTYTFTTADFGFTDPNDSPANNLLAVTITTLPGAGSLTLSGVAVTAGQSISAANITAGNLRFTPAANANGAGYASFTFQVQDNGGTANGGVDLDSTPNTITINVTAVNDAPVANNDSASGSEDTPITGNVLTNDTDFEGNALTAALVAGPANGTLTLNADGSFSYTPDPDWNGTDSFQYLVNDGSGLVHYWGLDGNGNDAISGTNGTLTNSPTMVAGHDGSALQFDGVDDHVALSDINYSSDFTLSFYFQVNDNTGNGQQYLYSHGTVGSTNVVHVAIGEAAYPTYANKLITTFLDSNDTTLPAGQLFLDISSLIGDGQWHLYTATVTSGVGTKVYIDGALSGMVASGGDGINPSGNAVIGARSDLNSTRFLNAGNSMDSVALYNRALSASEITSLAANSPQATVTLTVNPVNDAPVNTLTSSGAVIPEDTTVQLLDAVVIADVDGGSGSYTVTLSATLAAGTLSAASGGGVTVSGSGTSSLVLTGTLASINAYFAAPATAPFFVPVADYNGPVSVTVVTSDNGNSGSGGALTDSDTANGTIAPVADIADDNVTADEDTPVTFAPLGNDSFENAGRVITHIDGTAIATGGSLAVTGGSVTLNAGGTLTYAPTSNYSGTPTFTYTVTSGGTTETATVSVTVNPVNDAPTGSVTISGTPTQGQTLTASNTLADADGLGTISYQWQAGGVAISGATASTYLLTESEVGKVITVVASYTDGHGTAESVASADTSAVANLNDAPTGSVTIAGTATQGQTLTASNTLADADGLGAISYQWQAGGVAISGATASTYLLTESEVGKVITVVASYTDGHGTAESVASADTSAVANLNDAPTGSVTIAGTATQGQTLTAANTLADADGLGSISYQWQRGGVNIAGATGATYIATQADVGQTLTAVASYTDGHGTAESVTSAATAAVVNVNDLPTGSVTISGTATQGQTLTASNTLADADGLGAISYQWQAGGVAISGATASTYLLTESEVGKVITVVASYTDGHGTAESVASADTSAVANLNDAPTGSVTIAGTATQGQTLTAANTLADADGLGAISYQWQAGGVAISGATASTYLLTESEVGKVITVVASYTDGHGTAESVASADTSAVANLNDAPTGSVTIAGTATQGQTLTAANTLADADGLGSISYQWQRGGVNIAGATGATYIATQADVGQTLTAVASYTDGHGTAESVTSAATAAVVNVNDLPTGSVTISGTATQGQTLTAANTLADADGLGSISYQWQRGGVNIAGATGATYIATQADVGQTLTAVASYTDGHGTAESVTSAATAAVVNVNDLPTGSVTISGTATQGQTLTAANTLADADGLGSISYQWQRGGVNIAGATGATYIATQADVGQTLTAVASYTDGHGTAESVTSAATAAVVNVNDLPTGSVTISGTATQGQTLTAANTLADADGLGAISYQWQAGGVAISGATASTYLLTESEVGKVITVVASYTDGHGTAESVASADTSAVANLNDAPTGSVTIAGTATQGQTLTAANTLADADGLGSISYQWQRGGVNIAGATGATYIATQADVGQTLTAVASYTDGHGTAESVTSAATAAVVNVNDLPTGSVTISGTATQGQTLTAANTLADADGLGSISYQWQRGGVNIAGATGATYIATQADVGQTLTAVASYTDGHGTAESVTSAATAAVVNVNDLPTGSVTISGTATQGQTLTAANTLADADGLGAISYQWQAGGVAISGATASTYLLTESEVGKVITVVASYTDGHGTAESVASADTSAVANLNDAPTGSVTIAGTATQGQTLTASNTLADADGLGTITYHWLRGGVDTGTTGTSYLLAEADVGSTIAARATYTDGHVTSEAVTSAMTAAVATLNVAPVLTSASLALSEGETATLSSANFGLTDPDSTNFTYTVSALKGGIFQLSTNAGVAITSFTTADLAGNRVQFVDDGNEVAPSFSVKVNDSVIDSNVLAATITYTAVNDAPIVTSVTLTLSQGQTVTLSGANFAVFDPDDTNFTYEVGAISGGYFQLNSANGLPISSFSGADLADNRVQFVDDGFWVPPAFEVLVTDGKLSSAPVSAVIRVIYLWLPLETDVDNPPANSPQTAAPDGTRPVPDKPAYALGSNIAIVGSGGHSLGSMSSATGQSIEATIVAQSAPVFEVIPAMNDKERSITFTIVKIGSEGNSESVRLSFLEQYGLSINPSVVATSDQGRASGSFAASMPMTHREDQTPEAFEVKVDATRLAGIAFSVGAVWWAMRIGGLMASLFATVPTWRQFDPLLILPDEGEFVPPGKWLDDELEPKSVAGVEADKNLAQKVAR